MLTQKIIENYHKEYIDLLRRVDRDGMDDLIDWIESTDFFTAPASTVFHGNYPSGLLEHSLNVFVCLCRIANTYSQFDVPMESLIIAALCHDLCKANFYTVDYRNVKVYSDRGSKRDEGGRYDWERQPVYKVSDQYPLGHGEKSVILLQQHIKLTRDEILAIRWHMSGFDNAVRGGDRGQSQAYNECPLAAMLHMADLEASYLIEPYTHKED